jgi:integrase
MVVRKIRNAWWVDFRTDCIRYRKRSPENTKSGAEAYEITLRQRLAREEPIGRSDLIQQQSLLFRNFASKWYETYVVPNNKAGEQANKRTALNSCIIPFFGRTPIDTISSHHIEQYKAFLRKKDLSPKTINNRLTVLSTCLRTAYEWLELEGTPPKIKRLKYPPPRTDYLSLDECGLLLSQATGVLHEMLLIALRTGMRRGELMGLQWSSIDWQVQHITVRHSLCKYTGELGSPKSNRERHIPMDAEVYTLLFKRRRDTGYVFVDPKNNHFNGTYLERRLDELCKKAGLRKIGWHTLRHTFASHLAMKGVPLNAVQALLGHSSITTTMRYAHLAPSTLRAAIDVLNPKTAFFGDFGQPAGNTSTDVLQTKWSRYESSGKSPDK